MSLQPSIQSQLLTPNPYSRPGLPLRQVKKLVIHWVANPASSALANRNYFENLKQGTRGVYASSHYIVGLGGEIIQCIPDTEQAYHAKNANTYSLGIEVCHPDWEGQFDTPTYEALTQFLAKLCMTYTLDPATDILRHYDITGKVCPKFYVHHPAHFTKLKADVTSIIKEVYIHTPAQPPLPLSPPVLPAPESIILEINHVLVDAAAFIYKGNYYIRLRDLECNMLQVTYDTTRNIPILTVLSP